MINVIKAIKAVEKINRAKWDNNKSELNCVYFAPNGAVTRWYLTDTKIVAYGQLEQSIQRELLIPIKEIKKIKTFEFVEDGVKINDKKRKSINGRYPDIEKVVNPHNIETFTLKANFCELGTLLNALKHEVTISTNNGELKILQKLSGFVSSEFEYILPCEGNLPYKVVAPYGIYSLLAKERISSLNISTFKDALNGFITFETSFCKFLVISQIKG